MSYEKFAMVVSIWFAKPLVNILNATLWMLFSRELHGPTVAHAHYPTQEYPLGGDKVNM